MMKVILALAAVLAVLALLAPGGGQRHGVVVAQMQPQVPLGYRCNTPVGVCEIPPAPLKTPCLCGGAQGWVVP